MKVAAHTWWMVGRQLRNLMRETIWVVLLLIKPMIWLLYGQLSRASPRSAAGRAPSHSSRRSSSSSSGWPQCGGARPRGRRRGSVGGRRARVDGGLGRLARHRAARPPRGDDDRGLELRRAPAHVPLVDPDHAARDAALDAGARALQPGELGRAGGARAAVYDRNWDGVGIDILLLVAATAVTAGFATWTFRAYQRTL